MSLPQTISRQKKKKKDRDRHSERVRERERERERERGQQKTNTTKIVSKGTHTPRVNPKIAEHNALADAHYRQH